MKGTLRTYTMSNPVIEAIVDLVQSMRPKEQLKIYDFGGKKRDLTLYIYKNDFVTIHTFREGIAIDVTDSVQATEEDLRKELKRIFVGTDF